MTAAGSRGAASSLVALADSAWALWPDVVVRGAGFPAAGARALSDYDLARAADRELASQRPGLFPAAWQAAERRVMATTRRLAADARLREAVAWQNRGVLRDCFDKARLGEPRNQRGRSHELTVANYVQRYHLKNDTIGFFGPVGWASWNLLRPGLAIEPGDGLLASRRAYFEVWAIDKVGAALAADPALRPWLRPRPVASHYFDGRTVHVPGRPPRALPDAEAELLALCSGKRSSQEIADEITWAGHPELAGTEDVLAALERLQEEGLLRIGLEVPVEAFPEITLRSLLAEIPDSEVAGRVLATVDSMIAAKDAVGAAAGDAEAVAAAIDEANGLFERITGESSLRRPGRTYAGRTILYEDTVRDLRVELGERMLGTLAAPLALILDSAAWLVDRVARNYERLFLELHERVAGSTGGQVPLARLIGLATPQLFRSPRQLPEPVREAVAEFQRRWARLLDLRDCGRRHQVTVAGLAGPAKAAFPVRRIPWSGARRHAPDLLIAASSAEAINRGEYDWVLGELHLASNTMESRVFYEQHPDPPRLVALEQAVHDGNRVYIVPPKEWDVVTSRTYPPSALLAPDYLYWSLHADSGGMPGPVIPVAAMHVERGGDELFVRFRTGQGRIPLLEVCGELLSAAVVNAFRPLPRSAHLPRVTMDQLVLCRETWTFAAREIGWAWMKDEPSRYRQARNWRAAQELPERAFYRVAIEDKPVYLDFTSLVLVNLFAKTVRRAAEHQVPDVSLTEMLPDLGETWLTDHDGAGYTAELRMIAVSRLGRPDLTHI